LNPKQISILVNKSFLFCHNCHYFQENQKNEKSEYIKTDQSIMTDSSLSKSDKDIKDEIKIKEIKNKLNKKYCLVINLGETLIHNMNMPFGDYFFVRPGYFDLFEKVHDNFEIIIFTKEKKDAAEDIINKINYKNYIDNTFYEKNKIYDDDNFIKNLESIWGNPNNIIYVDNSRITDKNKKINLYKISSWYNNIFDSELIQLKNKLINLANKEILDKDNTQKII
jgi:TFIIF-interacting CTD phosphatase-like protein